MNLNIKTYSTIRKNKAFLNGSELFSGEPGQEAGVFLSSLYRSYEINYSKFFKMDKLSKLGFLASELLLKDHMSHEIPKEDIAIILWNSNSSLDADIVYQKTIESSENYFPSPADFVYTLPNIVIGEIAIRNKIHGETSFYISEKFNAKEIYNRILTAFSDNDVRQIICGWIDYLQGEYEAVLFLIDRNENQNINFTKENIHQLYNK